MLPQHEYSWGDRGLPTAVRLPRSGPASTRIASRGTCEKRPWRKREFLRWRTETHTVL